MKIFKLSDLSDYIPSEFNPSNRAVVYKELHLPEADGLDYTPMFSIPINVSILVANSQIQDTETGDILYGISGYTKINEKIIFGKMNKLAIQQSSAMVGDYFIEKRKVVDDMGNTHYKTYLLFADTSYAGINPNLTYIVTYSVSSRGNPINSSIVLENGLVKYVEEIPTTDINNNYTVFSSVVYTSGAYYLDIDTKQYETVSKKDPIFNIDRKYIKIPLYLSASGNMEDEFKVFITNMKFSIKSERFNHMDFYASSVYGVKSDLFYVEWERIGDVWMWVLYVNVSRIPIYLVPKVFFTYQITYLSHQELDGGNGELQKTGEYNHPVTFDTQYFTNNINNVYTGWGALGELVPMPAIQIWLPELSSNNKEAFLPCNITTYFVYNNVNNASILFYENDTLNRAYFQAKDEESDDWHWYVMSSCPKFKEIVDSEGFVVGWVKDNNRREQERLIVSYQIIDKRKTVD